MTHELGEHRIEISGATIMRQAAMTAHDWMMSARSDIDEIFGDGTAKKHPELIAAYMNAAAIDEAGTIIAQQVRCGLEELSLSVDNLRRHLAEAGRPFELTERDLEQISPERSGDPWAPGDPGLAPF